MNRRGFLGAISGLMATAVLDPERLLWVPGAKKVFIPKPPKLEWRWMQVAGPVEIPYFHAIGGSEGQWKTLGIKPGYDTVPHLSFVKMGDGSVYKCVQHRGEIESGDPLIWYGPTTVRAAREEERSGLFFDRNDSQRLAGIAL